MNQVVVTGIGLISPIGIGIEPFWQALLNGDSGIRAREEFSHTNWKFKLASQVLDFEGKQFVKPRKALKVMCRPIQFGCAAAKMAFDHSNVADHVDPERFSIVFGTESFYSDPNEVADVFRKCIVNQVYDHAKWGQFSMREIEPLWMLKYLPNMAASHISIALDARGPSNTICQSESSGSLSIIEGSDLIRRGDADVALVGGTGSPLSVTGAVYRGDQGLSSRVDEPALACRPFDRDRDGMVLGEGAGCLMLENREFAEKRGANILAQIGGYGRAFCLTDRPDFEKCLSYVMDRSIEEAGLDKSDIGHVNASGYSTQNDDAQEANAIHNTLGDVPVIAPKSNFGNLGPGTSVVELIASICALRAEQLPAVLNYTHPDSACPVNVTREVTATSKCSAVSINHSLTGQITAITVTA